MVLVANDGSHSPYGLEQACAITREEADTFRPSLLNAKVIMAMIHPDKAMSEAQGPDMEAIKMWWDVMTMEVGDGQRRVIVVQKIRYM